MYSKELLKGTITAIILKLLDEHKRMYGYEMAMKVRELTAGKIILKDGSLYPALQKLTADGLLSFEEEVVDGRTRKYYHLTKKGQKEKEVYVAELKDFVLTIQQMVFGQPKAA